MLRGLRARFFNEKRAKKKDDLLNCSAIGVAARHHSPMRVNGHHGHSASGNCEGQRRQDNDLLHGGSLPVIKLDRAPDWTAML